MKPAKIQIDRGDWQNCEYSFSPVPGKGYVLRIISPYRITLAILDSQPKPAQASPQPPSVRRPAKPSHEFKPRLPETPQEFITMAQAHSVLAGMWSDVKNAPFMASIEFNGELSRPCAGPGCSQPVTGVTAKYCGDACKQAAYRQRNSRNNRNNRNTGRKAA